MRPHQGPDQARGVARALPVGKGGGTRSGVELYVFRGAGEKMVRHPAGQGYSKDSG
jgi:hypothetical protein